MKRLIHTVTYGVSVFLLFFCFVKTASAQERWYQATATWPTVAGVSSYNLYFKESTSRVLTHAVRDIPAAATRYTVGYLKKGRAYRYVVTAVNSEGKEYLTTGLLRLSPLSAMP